MPKKVKNKRKKTVASKTVKKPKARQSNPIDAILLFGISILLFCVVLIPGENIWLASHNFILSLFGKCSIIWPILLLFASLAEGFVKKDSRMNVKIWLTTASITLFCAIFYVFSAENLPRNDVVAYIVRKFVKGDFNETSGILGAILGTPMMWAFGKTGAKIIIFILLFITLMFLTSTTLSDLFKAFAKPLEALKNNLNKENLFPPKSEKIVDDEDQITADKILMGAERNYGLEKIKNETAKTSKIDVSSNPVNSKEAEEIAKVTAEFMSKIKNKKQEPPPEFKVSKDKLEKQDINYKFPPLELLNKSVIPDDRDISEELQNNGKMLVETLKSFNVQTKIVAISRGPAVTRYELQPAAGVKISKITVLSDDIALNLAASGVRIEAPIPGKSAVGVEIPNKIVSIVNMRELIDSAAFSNSKSKLTVVLGRDISGQVVVADLAKMPHLLIAGSTGSGKSVCINSFIISLLYNSNPEEVKLLMVDPKVVELGVYNGIPHLLVPVVTDPRKAAGALNWAVNEMLNRYKRFAENNVRDLQGYNSYVERHPDMVDGEGEPLKKMAQIVIIIDELSDLMMAAPNEVEDYICRLAQMARAAGMHLVIATQRPSVDVITGIIKANIPSRIALAVSSQIDSRTILDSGGAEKLLGRGDMLFAPVGSSKPIRVQGCFVTDEEVEKIIRFIKDSGTVEYDKKIAEEIEKNALPVKNAKSSDDEEDFGEGDVMMEDAIKCVIEIGEASTSLLQRRLRVGYARAGRLIDQMEQMGIVGPHNGSKPRQVLINYAQFLERKNRE